MQKKFANHAGWAKKHLGDVSRSWFILCSAPSPTVPASIPDETIFVCVNNSGLTAHALGLRSADLTIRAEKKSWKEIHGLHSKALLWISKKPLFYQRIQALDSFKHKANAVRRITVEDRDNIMRMMLNDDFPSNEHENRPSNGIFAIAYALSCGAFEVIVSGFSLTQGGHSYNDLDKRRRHIDPDKAALIYFAENNFPVSTTETNLADITGLRLAGDAHSTHADVA
jgi:hypothetical protein